MKKRREIKRPWWYVAFRSMHYYAFKYWGVFLFTFSLLLGLWYWWCYLPYCENKAQCCLIVEYKKKVQTASKTLEDCCNCNSSLTYDENEIDKLRKSYGGKIGDVTVTLVWETEDDLDLHLVEPSGEKIFYGYRLSNSGGELDVDKNAGGNLVTNPIENIYYASRPPSGKYSLFVNFFKRNSEDYSLPYQVYINIGSEQKIVNGTHVNEKDNHAIYEFTIP